MRTSYKTGRSRWWTTPIIKVGSNWGTWTLNKLPLFTISNSFCNIPPPIHCIYKLQLPSMCVPFSRSTHVYKHTHTQSCTMYTILYIHNHSYTNQYRIYMYMHGITHTPAHTCSEVQKQHIHTTSCSYYRKWISVHYWGCIPIVAGGQVCVMEKRGREGVR